MRPFGGNQQVSNLGRGFKPPPWPSRAGCRTPLMAPAQTFFGKEYVMKFSPATFQFAQRLVECPDASPPAGVSDFEATFARQAATFAREIGVYVVPILQGFELQLTEKGSERHEEIV